MPALTPIASVLDAAERGYRGHGKFHHVFCSQCGCEFGPNYHGYSHCEDHAAIDATREKP
jgi:hypothetical protein